MKANKRRHSAVIEIFVPLVLTFAVMAIFIAALTFVSPTASAPRMASSAVRIDVADGHGSGVYIGHRIFVTAAHVAKEAKDGKLTVHSNTGVDYKATVLWYNETYDVALLRTDGSVAVAVSPLHCGAPELTAGAVVTAVGNPLALDNIQTWGYVARSTATFATNPRRAFIADLTIAPGNSGGPVFDAQGNLVGIAVAMAAMQVGLGAALFPLSYIVPASAICMLTGR